MAGNTLEGREITVSLSPTELVEIGMVFIPYGWKQA